MVETSMNCQTAPVTFLNKDGMRLFGMLHRPIHVEPSWPAILLLSPGVKMRVAPHRLYNKMIERFVRSGYCVFRFDFYGLGDSEGEVTERYLADLYGAVQVGRYINDTVAAMDWMRDTCGTTRFIAGGLCGGALTGLLTASRDPRIIGLMGLSIPVILDGAQIDFSKYMTEAQLKGIRDSYLGKVFDMKSWRSWVRFVTFQSDFKAIARSVLKPIMARLLTPASSNSNGSEAVDVKDNTNPYFAPAFRRMAETDRPILLIFAEMDRLYWEFEKKFMDRHRAMLESFQTQCDLHIVKQANHIFSFHEWETEMLDLSCQWLERVTVRRGQSAVSSRAGVA